MHYFIEKKETLSSKNKNIFYKERTCAHLELK